MTNSEMQEALSVTKMAFMMNKGSLFLGSVAGKLLVSFPDSCPTACVGSKVIQINPTLWANATKRGRLFIYRHEVQHVARLHALRRGDRIPEVWNVACDYVINTFEFKSGIGPVTPDDLNGIQVYVDTEGKFTGMDEEQVYDYILDHPGEFQVIPSNMGQDCMIPDEDDGPQEVLEHVRIVQEAQEVCAMSGGSGDGITVGARNALVKYVKPVVPWEGLIRRWARSFDETRARWSRPNRRHLPYGVYKPTVVRDIGSLDEINFYRDISGSVSEKDRDRVHSEMKHIFDIYKPSLMRDVPFNDAIFDERELRPGHKFEDLAHISCGGTWLGCVKEHIENTKPTLAVIFSDLECAPMEPLEIDIPVLWIVFGNYNPEVPFGTKIYIGDA